MCSIDAALDGAVLAGSPLRLRVANDPDAPPRALNSPRSPRNTQQQTAAPHPGDSQVEALDSLINDLASKAKKKGGSIGLRNNPPKSKDQLDSLFEQLVQDQQQQAGKRDALQDLDDVLGMLESRTGACTTYTSNHITSHHSYLLRLLLTGSVQH